MNGLVSTEKTKKASLVCPDRDDILFYFSKKHPCDSFLNHIHNSFVSLKVLGICFGRLLPDKIN